MINNAVIPLPENFFFEMAQLAWVLIGFGVIFVIAEAWHILGQPPAEWTRKFVHVSGGIIVACLHWIFTSNWPVIVLGIIIATIMIYARLYKKLPWIFGINRRSHGEIYYIFAITSLFIISHPHPIYYFIAALILTLSDTVAALIGSTYHRMAYVVEFHHKSVEGSSAFFCSTFAIITLALWLLLFIPLSHATLIALPISLFLTCLEAICPNGTDNIFIPLAAYLLLHFFVPLPHPEIIQLLLWEVALLIFCLAISWKFRLFTASGAISFHFVLFGAYALNDWTWLITPLLALITLLLFFSRIPLSTRNEMFKASRVVTTFYITLVPATLILLNFFVMKFPNHEISQKIAPYIFPTYVGTVCGQLLITLWRILKLRTAKITSHQSTLRLRLAALVLTTAIIPLSFWVHPQDFRWMLLQNAFETAFAIPACYAYLSWWLGTMPFPWEFRIQMLCAALGTCIGMWLELL